MVCLQSYGQVGYTPAGRAFNLADGTFGATANAAFLGLAFGQIIRPWRPDLADIYLCWARQQVRPALCRAACAWPFHIPEMHTLSGRCLPKCAADMLSRHAQTQHSSMQAAREPSTLHPAHHHQTLAQEAFSPLVPVPG